VITLTPVNDITHDIIQLIEKFPEIQSPLLTLLTTCKNDIPGTTISNEQGLLDYAHGVAGTVGLLMYPILGGTAEEGRKAANHLGIAMQCSNIARDVLKDFEQNREYLPSEWLHGYTVRELLTSAKEHDHYWAHQALLTEAIQKLLQLANTYYESGLAGLRYLHPRNRFAIRVAARCYQAIGQRVLTKRHQIATERSVVPLYEKCLITLKQARWLRKDYLDPISESKGL
jgi:phytoene synthase